MARRVRCAVIGAGWWGTTAHIPALLRHPLADLRCVHHRDRKVAQRIARYGRMVGRDRVIAGD